MIRRIALLYIIMLSVFLGSCVEDAGFSSNPSLRLEFSCDTVSFDTLFSEVMSPTAKFLVRNRNDKALRISSVQLEGGGASPFSVLVDGQYGTSMYDLELRARDSLYVLASVTVDRNGSDVPLMVKDSLLFTLESGVRQSVLLLAYGRDVTFLHSGIFAADTVLAPGHYVIYDSLTVAQGATLSLQPGTTLYFHDKAFLKVDGSLKAEGTASSPIVFRGDRTDKMFSYLPYDHIPGQWDGVLFTSTSNDNLLVHCDIHSANYGIRVEQGDTVQNRITIESSKVQNFHGNALELVMARATAVNSLFANAQGNCVKVVGGDVNDMPGNFGKDYVTIKFRNGSQFDVVGALESTLGGRRQGGLIDEVKNHDEEAINTIVLPLLNVSRRMPNNEVNPKEPNQQVICCTSAWQKMSFAYDKLISIFENSIMQPMSSFCMGCDYRVPMIHGLLEQSYINKLKLDPSFNEVSFATEYLSLWQGASDESWFNFDKLQNYRKIKNPETHAKFRPGSN